LGNRVSPDATLSQKQEATKGQNLEGLFCLKAVHVKLDLSESC
jgi:hypothetical protein